MKHFEHVTAQSYEAAAQALTSYKHAQPMAGGTDLMGVLKERILPDYPEAVVNLKEIPDSSYIIDEGDHVAIGAMTKLCDLEQSPLLSGGLKAVAQAAHSVASPIIRNTATIGGNLCQDVRCWYYRYPNSVGGRLMCARKGGQECFAIQGRNQYHSVMGGMKAGKTPCTLECPAGTDIPAYMEKIRENDWDGAAQIIMRVNPMPMLTARVCPHNCQSACNQCQHGDPVSIHSVERALGDYILEHRDKFYQAPASLTGKKAGIVGGGPAGLTAAYFLRKAGHEVTIYEKMEEAGGVLMYGIPEYRLPKHYVRDLIKALESMGILFKTNTEIGKDMTLDEVKSANDTVFLDTGAWKQPILGIDGENLTQFGLNFLVEVKKFMSRQIGKEVLVCGGGNVAMDVALTAVRLGAEKVKLVCLEQREDMPASAEEIARAEEEGVEIVNGWGLKKVIADEDGTIRGLESMRCVSVFDDQGHFSPSYSHETQVFSSDCIILATGQKVDTDFLGSRYKDQLKNAKGLIEVGEHKDTRAPGIYAGGDAASGPSVAIKAIRDGGIAARSMSSYMGFPIEAAKAEDSFLKFDEEKVSVKKAAVETDTPVGERCLDKEDSVSLTPDQARDEAGRCMNCGCYSVNASDMANVMVALGATIKTTKHQFKAEEFFSSMHAVDLLEPGELVTEVCIPKWEGYRTGYSKLRVRDSIDFAITALAYAYKEKDGRIEDVRLAAGGIAPIPVRLTQAEQVLKGQEKSRALAVKAFEKATETAVPMKENHYKLQEIKTQMIRSLEL